MWNQLVNNITKKMTPDRLIDSGKIINQNNKNEFSPFNSDLKN